MSDWVSQREFDRLEETVNEIHTDVKLLLAAHNQDVGANEERRELLDATRDQGARRLAWGALAASSVGGLWWVADALARITHH